MKRTKNNKGITLIALVVTIIVLLILAGVTIATLMGDNGILTRANGASVAQIEGRVKEEVKLAVQSAKMYAEEMATRTKEGWLAEEQLEEVVGQMILYDLTGDKGYTVTRDDEAGIITVTYETEAYKKATNNTNAKIVIVIIVSGNTFTIEQANAPKPEVTESKVVANSDGTGEDTIETNSQIPGTTTLYISFKASIEGGTIKSVICDNGMPALTNGIYVTPVTANGTYNFTIVGTVDGEEYTKTYSITVDKYDLRAGLNVGDYINYEPDSTSATTYSKDKLTESYTGHTDNKTDIKQDKLNWQILKKYDDGSMDIIGSLTTQKICFKGATGYNNGVYILDDICKTLYSREGIEARSVDIEDFESNLTEAGKKAKAENIATNIASLSAGNYISSIDIKNNTVTWVKSRSYYPMLYKQEQNNGVGRSDKYYTKDTLITTDGIANSYEQAETLTVPNTFYTISTNMTNYGEAYKVLTSVAPFWLGSRCTMATSNFMCFNLKFAYSNLSASSLFWSNGSNSFDNNCYLRPVITLGPEVQITASATATNSATPHEITKY